MFLINKIISKNPINSQTMDKINKIIVDSLTIFIKNYTSQTNIVAVENKIKEYELKEKRKVNIQKDKNKKIKYYKKIYGKNAQIPNIPEIPEKDEFIDKKIEYSKNILNLGFKPLFPREKMTPLKTPELIVELNRYVIRDAEYDPYAAYIIKTSLGAKIVEKERRFKEFANLNTTLKNYLTKDCLLPSSSSKFGSRNLEIDFLNERVKLLNDYLQKLKNIKEVINNEAFRKFIGLYEEDPLEVQIFEAAFKATKYELCIWDDIKYDDPISALSKLLVRKIWKNVKMDIYAEVPKGESTRKASLKLAYKIITGVIEKAVPAAWNQAYDSSRKVRGINQKMLERVIELIIEKKKI